MSIGVISQTRDPYQAAFETQKGNHLQVVDAVVAKSAALSDAEATQLINSQPETARVVAQTTANLTVPGIAHPVYTVIFRGDSSAIGYQLTAGRWMNGPGEAVAPMGLVLDAHLRVPGQRKLIALISPSIQQAA